MRGCLTIDLGALARNYRTIQNMVGENCTASAVVKADAYGLGVAPVAKALLENGTESFFVANLDEASALRGILGEGAVIYTLNGFEAECTSVYEGEGITPVLNSLEDVQAFGAHGQDLPAPALHIDTGMNRLGIRADRLDALQGQDFSLVMSHFACADEKDHSMNAAQFEVFQAAAKHFPGTKKSLANSSGVFRSNTYHFDMVRPGMCLYGLNPRPETKNPMEAVVSLSVPILQIRDTAPGETCGYNATYRFKNKTRLAVVALGYADGFLRSLSNAGALYWRGIPCPVRGRVSMDLTIIDLGAVPENDLPRAGDMVEVIGPHQSADDLAASAGTIGYEILTSLGARHLRHYMD